MPMPTVDWTGATALVDVLLLDAHLKTCIALLDYLQDRGLSCPQYTSITPVGTPLFLRLAFSLVDGEVYFQHISHGPGVPMIGRHHNVLIGAASQRKMDIRSLLLEPGAVVAMIGSNTWTTLVKLRGYPKVISTLCCS